MENLIKDKSLILSEKINLTNGTDYTLKNGAKLGEVFHFLPYGIIDKKETGIGATTLEIKSERNSIIVLPTRYTARSKSLSEPKSHYFGDNGSKKISLGRKVSLNNYLKDESIKFKKIIVVADSLRTLIEHIGVSVYSDFFLLIDEIDTIQKDSSYRKKMELCIEYYKLFPFEKRAVVSATLLTFSDPDLFNAKITSIKYETYKKGTIALVSSDSPLETATELLIDILNSTSDKIVFAFNEITPIENIASYLIEKEIIGFNDISILCGQNPKNKDRVDKFNSKGIEKAQLPTRVNFMTSAYFTGFDINESYQLIMVSDINRQHTIISEFDAIQIIGRCRKPYILNSINFLYSMNTKKFPVKKKEELIQAAKQEIEGLNCIINKYSNHPLLREKALELRSSLIKASGFSGFNFVKENSLGKNDISYLNIDAFLENQRTKSIVFRNNNFLQRFFSAEGYITQCSIKNSSIALEQKSNDISRNNNVDTLAFLKTDPDDKSISEYKLKNKGLSVVICDFYIRAINILGKKDTLSRLDKCDTKKKVNDLSVALNSFMTDSQDFVKRNIQFDFPVGRTFISKEQLEKQIEETAINISNFDFNRLSKTKAKKHIKSFVEFKSSTRRENGKHIKITKVASHNPFNFRKCKPKNVLIYNT